MKNPESFDSSPIIRITENREVIERKLAEYSQRLDQYMAPETQLDTIYKIAIAQRLVETGEVNTHDLSLELKEKYGNIDVAVFDNACGVLADYITTGGKHTTGGTGLHMEKDEIEEVEEGKVN